MTPLFSAPLRSLEVGARFTTRGRTDHRGRRGRASPALTGDWHPQHTDAEWAARAPFGERIAHGMLVVSCAVGLVPFDPERVVALRRVRDVDVQAPGAARRHDPRRGRDRRASRPATTTPGS